MSQTEVKVDWEREIRRCRSIARQAEDSLVKAVRGARRAGSSWPAIGRALGTSHQAAHARFADKVK